MVVGAGPRDTQDVPDGRKVMTASIMRIAGKHRRPSVAQITLTQEEAAALRGALSSDVSDRRMEIAHTDSWQWRQGLKREAVLLKKLLEQFDAELTLAGAPYSLASLPSAYSRHAEVSHPSPATTIPTTLPRLPHNQRAKVGNTTGKSLLGCHISGRRITAQDDVRGNLQPRAYGGVGATARHPPGHCCT